MMRLPPPDALERRWMAAAVLDAVMSPEWEMRLYSFDRQWSTDTGARMGSMRDGSGDDVFTLFRADGTVAIKGFAHESPAWRGDSHGIVPGVFEGLPSSFASDFLHEPAFGTDCTTFCLWHVGSGWQRSAAISPAIMAVDGSATMLELFEGDASTYAAFARDYFEVDLSVQIIERVYHHEPMTVDLARAIRPDVDLATLANDLDQIGYPGRLPRES